MVGTTMRSGDDDQRAEWLRSAFRENGIPFRTPTDLMNRQMIEVRSEDLPRVREILREADNATPVE